MWGLHAMGGYESDVGLVGSADSVVSAASRQRGEGGEGGEGTGCVLSRGGLPLGCSSAPFSPQQLSEALDLLEARPAQTVMVEREGGALVGRGGASAALAAAAARLAPHPPAATAELRLLRGAPGWLLALAVTRSLAPLHELRLWPDSTLRALVGITPLAPVHIRGKAEYVCERCGSVFEHPNPLKVHRFLRCAPPRAPALLRRLLAALRGVPPPPPAPPATALPPGPLLAAAGGEAEAGGAAVEALCAEWGARAAQLTGGHQCLYCGKTYSRRYGLKIHVRTHTGYRPLRCPHCARRFGDPSNLNKHVRLHGSAGSSGSAGAGGSGPARHRCGQCGEVTARRRDLERHHRARHSSPG